MEEEGKWPEQEFDKGIRGFAAIEEGEGLHEGYFWGVGGRDTVVLFLEGVVIAGSTLVGFRVRRRREFVIYVSWRIWSWEGCFGAEEEYQGKENARKYGN